MPTTSRPLASMELVLYNIHCKWCNYILRKSNRWIRSRAEECMLALTVCSFVGLVLIHRTFCFNGASSIPSKCLSSIPGFVMEADITHLVLIDERESLAIPMERWQTECPWTATSSDAHLSYATKQDWLRFPSLWDDLDVQYVGVSKTDPNCFGEPFLQSIVFSVLGPDTVMVNWFVGLYQSQGGFISWSGKNELSLDLHPSTSASILYNAWHKLAMLVKTAFLFFTTTTLVSFTLRETQRRMLTFTHHLLQHVQANRPVVHLVTQHLAENMVFVPIMVGIIFFLVEFYRGDKFLAFSVLTIVWICESFSVVSIRTKQGIHFFPKVFFLLFALFHFYYFSYPFGFSYAALGTFIFSMLHNMLFFWHRYELPAVCLGQVSPQHPREDLFSRSSSSSSQQDPSPEDSPQPAPQRPPRNFSFGTFTSSVDPMSRNSSSANLFNRDEDDASAFYGVNGEIVVHHNIRAPSPLERILPAIIDGEGSSLEAILAPLNGQDRVPP